MKPLPLGVRVAAGLAATALEQARKLPQQLAGFPLTVVSEAMQLSMRMQEHVTELAQDGPLLAIDVLAQRPLERAHILVVPAASGAEVPAYLRYGAWNECPRPEFHVAMLRSWQERYGAELISMGADTVELRVKRRPGSMHRM